MGEKRFNKKCNGLVDTLQEGTVLKVPEVMTQS